ncbi:MAG: Crp/Fnr family transcriptional regulator [Syntrophales bacterium]|nr:Crp/Fnr family transcriptional regulator [Syntrophales bacterium]
MKNIREILTESRLFGGLSPEHLGEIERITIVKDYDKGEVIFHEGDAGRGFYLIAAGRVCVYKVSAEGKEQILHILEEGETVGAVPVFAGGSFPAHARALVKSRLFFFDRRDFVRLLGNKPNLAMNLLAILSARLREFTIQVENLSLREIPARLAAYLLYLAQEQNNPDYVRLNISKVRLANLLGTGPESLSRALGSLKAGGFIAEEGEIIRLLHPEELQHLADRGKISR